MQKKLWFLILSFITIGCSEKVVYLTGPTTTKTDTVIVNAGMQTVNISVDWNKLKQSITSKLNDGMAYAISDSGLNITHIGSRLVYVKDNASFTQSVVKDTGSTSLITLQVPPTDTAHLYVLAVHQSANGTRKALKMGVKRNIRILANTPINLTLDSLTLLDTDWSLADSTLSLTNDTIRVIVSDTSTRKIVKVEATDPYQLGASPILFSNRIVKFYGTGYHYDNVGGWRRLGIEIQKKGTGTSTDTFWPYVDGSLFNLNGEYLIGKQGIIKTTWQ